ncbi:MAG TPA: tyrosine-type recombinase/integrase [Bacillota bacterium]|nr:tyrosine-type recombinase/integrase [Bacillota bacterium]
MNYVPPITDQGIIENLKSVLLHQSYRNYFFFMLAINSGIPCDSILPLKVKDVRDKDFITIKGKIYDFNDDLKIEISRFAHGLKYNDYLFAAKTRQKSKPISRNRVNKFLNNAAHEVGLEKIGFHTLRKTLGWFHYQKYKDIKYLQELFEHPAPSYTLKYLGLMKTEEQITN